MLGLLLFLPIFCTADGEWRCMICDKGAYRWYSFSLCIASSEDRDRLSYGTDDQKFSQWFEANIGRPHEHQWFPFGNQAYYGGCMMCSDGVGA